MTKKKSAKKPECKFKVGDIVIAHKDAPYGITTNGWKGKVISVRSENVIDVQRLKGGDSWPVDPQHFDLYEPAKIHLEPAEPSGNPSEPWYNPKYLEEENVKEIKTLTDAAMIIFVRRQCGCLDCESCPIRMFESKKGSGCEDVVARAETYIGNSQKTPYKNIWKNPSNMQNLYNALIRAFQSNRHPNQNRVNLKNRKR